MRLTPLFAWPILAFALSGASAPLLNNYTVTDLGAPTGGGGYSESHAINLSGSVAGDWGSNFIQDAFLYQSGTNSNIVANGIAYGLNNSGVVVGEAGITFVHAFVYSNGMATDPGSLGGTYSVAWAINNNGQIVGESTVSNLPNAEDHGIWWHDGLKTDLGILPGGDYSSARGINDSNIIVGEASVISGGVTNTYAFVYTNSLHNLGTLSGGNYSSAKAINNIGWIVGEASTSSGDTHAFLYSGGVMKDLGTLGGTLSSASAINNTGNVVGYATSADGQEHGFLYSGAGMVNLDTCLSPGSPCTNLVSADAINDAGQIAGSGYTTNGDYHAFLLTPIVPTLRLGSPVMLGNNQFQFTVYGPAGRQFVLLGSDTLSAWARISTNVLTTNWFTCTVSATNSMQFYRAKFAP